MEVKHALPCPGTTVDDDTVAGLVQLVLPRQAIGKVQCVAHQIRVRFRRLGQGRNMFGGDDKQMGGRLRIDILNGKQPFGFSDDVCWKCALCDPAKEALQFAHDVAGASLDVFFASAPAGSGAFAFVCS